MTQIRIQASYVLGLPRLGRLDDFYASLPSERVMPRPQLFEGLDVQHAKIPDWWTELPAMFCCNRGHMGMIQLALLEGHEVAAFHEDDCRYMPDSDALIESALSDLPNDWHGLMLGGQVSVFDGHTVPVSKHLSKCIQVERCHAYILNREGMRIFYEDLCQQNSLPIDYRFGDLQESGALNVYRVEPFVAKQADGLSTISDRVEASRIWDDRVDVRLRSVVDVPIISLVCPFDVMCKLRDDGVITNGGQTPPFLANVARARIEAGEVQLADMMLDTMRNRPARFEIAVRELRNDAAFHRSATFALWHPTEVIAYPNAPVVRADTVEAARAMIDQKDAVSV